MKKIPVTNRSRRRVVIPILDEKKGIHVSADFPIGVSMHTVEEMKTVEKICENTRKKGIDTHSYLLESLNYSIEDEVDIISVENENGDTVEAISVENIKQKNVRSIVQEIFDANVLRRLISDEETGENRESILKVMRVQLKRVSKENNDD